MRMEDPRKLAWLQRSLCMAVAGGMAVTLLAGPVLAWSYKEAAEPYRGTTIRVLDEVTPLQETFANMVPEFEEETGIKVEYELLNHFEVINKGQADMLSGRGFYDAVMNHSFQHGLLLDADVLRPLDDLLADKELTNPDLDLDDLIDPSFSTLSSFNGQTYGFLNWNYNVVYWARKDLLEHPDERAAFKAKYGYELKPAKTMQQVRDIAEFFTREAGEKLAGETLESDFYGIVMEGLNGGTTYETVWYIYIRNAGGELFNDKGEPTIDTPKVIEGIKMWADLWQFAPPGQAEYSLIDVPTVMGNGIAAQAVAWSDFVLGIDKPGASDYAGQFTYAATPRNADNGGRYYSAGEPSAINISVHSDNPEATYLFLQWAIDKKTQARYLDLGKGGVPIRESSWSHPALTGSRLADLYEAMRGSLKGVHAAPKAPNFLEIADVLNRVFQQVGIGELTPAEGAAKAQEEVLSICETCIL